MEMRQRKVIKMTVERNSGEGCMSMSRAAKKNWATNIEALTAFPGCDFYFMAWE